MGAARLALLTLPTIDPAARFSTKAKALQSWMQNRVGSEIEVHFLVGVMLNFGEVMNT